MPAILLKDFLAHHGLEPGFVARELFPDNKFPTKALDRVLKNQAYLNSEQVSRLAALARVPVSHVFNAQQWRQEMRSGQLLFYRADYRAELDQTKWTTRLFHRDSLFHIEMLHSRALTLREYLDHLDLLISQHEFKAEN